MIILYNRPMSEYTSAARRSWVAYYLSHGNVSATCREFGISRATFYKWLSRYDPEKPSRSLRSRSRRPHNPKRGPRWSRMDLQILAELSMNNPTWGAGRLAKRMQELEIPVSRPTAGRMLSRIMRRCPVCNGVQGRHRETLHALNRDLLTVAVRMDEDRGHRGLPPLSP